MATMAKKTLDALGPEEFIKYAKDIARPGPRFPLPPHPPARGLKVHFEQLIRLLYKFTPSQFNPVKLDAEIVDSAEVPDTHRLRVWGVADVDFRAGRGARALLRFRKGRWECSLEKALEQGISHEEIKTLRGNIHLRARDGISDDEFFRIPI